MASLAVCSWLRDVRGISRGDWPPPAEQALPHVGTALHRTAHWVFWPGGKVTSAEGLGGPIPIGELRPDATELIDAVWHSDGHRDFRDWETLSRIERVAERELLGVRWPLPWEERLERLLVETVDGSLRTLFVHSVLPEERLSSGRVTVTLERPHTLGDTLDRPEPMVLYDLENPLHGTPKVTAGAPRYVVVRPRSRCVTAFHRRMPRNGGVPVPKYTRRDHPSLRAVMSEHALHPNQVRPVWAVLEDVPLATVATIEAQRWNLKVTLDETPAGLMLVLGDVSYGPCGNPWDVASILAACSPARRKPVVRARGTKPSVKRASGQARR